MLLFGVVMLITSMCILHLKYRVVIGGEKCNGKIVGITSKSLGGAVNGLRIKKNAYMVRINNQSYYTAHGRLILSLGKKRIGKEIYVYKNEKYGKEVFETSDFSIEILAFLLVLVGFLLIYAGYQ